VSSQYPGKSNEVARENPNVVVNKVNDIYCLGEVVDPIVALASTRRLPREEVILNVESVCRASNFTN
jgi:hypothetical protein